MKRTRMNSPSDFQTPVKKKRIPDEEWAELEDWAEQQEREQSAEMEELKNEIDELKREVKRVKELALQHKEVGTIVSNHLEDRLSIVVSELSAQVTTLHKKCNVLQCENEYLSRRLKRYRS